MTWLRTTAHVPHNDPRASSLVALLVVYGLPIALPIALLIR